MDEIDPDIAKAWQIAVVLLDLYAAVINELDDGDDDQETPLIDLMVGETARELTALNAVTGSIEMVGGKLVQVVSPDPLIHGVVSLLAAVIGESGADQAELISAARSALKNDD